MKNKEINRSNFKFICKEDFNAMQESSNGKFCSKCKMEVIDLDIYPAPNKEFCGKITKSSKPDIIVPYWKYKLNSTFQNALLSIGLFLSISNKKTAQNHTRQIQSTASFIADSSKIESKIITIKVMVKDSATNEPIPFAIIDLQDSLGNSIAKEKSDLDGVVNVNLTKSRNKNEKGTITVNCNGYNTIKIQNVPFVANIFKINLQISHDRPEKNGIVDSYIMGLIKTPE